MAALLAASCWAGCSGDSGPAIDSEGAVQTGGTVIVAEVKGQIGYVAGEFYQPGLVRPGSELVAEVGGCSAYRELVCDDVCLAGTYCTDFGSCEAVPVTQSTGTLYFDGFYSDLLDLVPQGTRYPPLLLDYDVFNRGARLSVESSGADIPAFSATVTAPNADRFDVPASATAGWPALTNADFTIGWDPDDLDAQVQLTLSSSGSPGFEIVCIEPDDGTLVVPGALLGDFLADEHWSVGPGRGLIERFRRTEKEIAPDYRVSFRAAQQVYFDVNR